MSELYNFADDDTISTASKNMMNNLIQTLEKELETEVEWFNQNKTTVKRNKNNQSCLKINNQIIKATNYVKSLGIDIDSKLNFDSHSCIHATKPITSLNGIYWI